MSGGGEVLDGEVPFVRRVPWRLRLPAGAAGAVPLLTALHGKGDRAERFEAEALEALPDGWALLLPSGPIPRDRDGARPGTPPGDSWYLYDGDGPAFAESLSSAQSHLDRVIRAARAAAKVRGVELRPEGLLGFSQGAYLAGIAAARKPRRGRRVVLVGGRFKHEILGESLPAARGAGLAILSLHGEEDAAVLPGPARASTEAAAAAGLPAEFRAFPGGHAFTPAMRAAARAWLAGPVG